MQNRKAFETSLNTVALVGDKFHALPIKKEMVCNSTSVVHQWQDMRTQHDLGMRTPTCNIETDSNSSHSWMCCYNG